MTPPPFFVNRLRMENIILFNFVYTYYPHSGCTGSYYLHLAFCFIIFDLFSTLWIKEHLLYIYIFISSCSSFCYENSPRIEPVQIDPCLLHALDFCISQRRLQQVGLEIPINKLTSFLALIIFKLKKPCDTIALSDLLNHIARQVLDAQQRL